MRGLALIGTLALAVAILAAVGSARAAAPRTATVSLQGAERGRAQVCGVRRPAAIALQGRRVVAIVRPARQAVVLTIDRCRAGRWARVLTVRRSGRRGALRAVVPTGRVGALRLRAATGTRTGGTARARAAYLLVTAPPGNARPQPAADVVDVPVSFAVRNVNRSGLACHSDGAEHRVAGRLVAPRAALESGPGAVTLYLHEFSWGKFFFAFPIPAYDYARAQARAGHVAVVVDRLGYDDSPGPNGNETCIGAQADMAHQMVQALRTGSYTSPDRPARAFRRVALGGHSVGAGIAELAAFSFRDVDALVLLGWAAQGYTPGVIRASFEQNLVCARGGEPAEPGRPAGYAYISQSGEEFAEFSIADAEPAAVELAVRLRNRDPCGDAGSVAAANVLSNARSGEIEVPVLLVYGLADGIYQQPSAGQTQSEAYPASSDVTTIWIERAGHALTIQRSAATMRNQVFEWLAPRGL